MNGSEKCALLPTRGEKALLLSGLTVQTCHLIRITDTDVGGFLSDTTVLHFDTDFNKIYGDIIFNHIMYASQNYSTME